MKWVMCVKWLDSENRLRNDRAVIEILAVWIHSFYFPYHRVGDIWTNTMRWETRFLNGAHCRQQKEQVQGFWDGNMLCDKSVLILGTCCDILTKVYSVYWQTRDIFTMMTGQFSHSVFFGQNDDGCPMNKLERDNQYHLGGKKRST